MTQYLKQRGSGTIYIATPELLKQADLDPYEPEAAAEENTAKPGKKGKKVEAAAEAPAPVAEENTADPAEDI